MAYPVTLVISEAFYTSGIVSRQFQTVAGDQEETGFLKLNEILTDTGIESDMIPYFQSSYTFNAIAGQEMYFIPNLTVPETITFNLNSLGNSINNSNSVRYQMQKTSRDRYFGSGRANGINSLPFKWHIERCFGGSNLFMYFLPQQPFPMTLTGLFTLQKVSLYQDLSSPNAVADLGVQTINGAGVLGPGELVVNGIDLAGTYVAPIDLTNFVNTGVIPNVRATLNVAGHFILNNLSGTSITIVTTGNAPTNDNVTFSNFSVTNGPMSQTFLPISLDQYYINYLIYRLADKLCSAYNFVLPPGPTKELAKYQMMISKRSSPLDLSLTKMSTLTIQQGVNYSQINLGRGWTTN